MKVKHFLLALTFLSQMSFADQQTAEQNQNVGLEFDSKQVQEILSKLKDTTLSDADQILIDSILRNPNDKPGIESAQSIISKRLQWSMYELSELKKTVLRFMIISSQVKDKKYLAPIAKNYQAFAQDHYNKALWSLAGVYDDQNTALSECATDLCAIQVTEAFQEMVTFVKSVNDDVDFTNTYSEVKLFWKFNNPIIKSSLNKIFNAMVPNNEDHNAWKVAGAALLAPLSFAGQAVTEVAKVAGRAVIDPRFLKIDLEIEEVDMDYKLITEKLDTNFNKELPGIINGRETPSMIEAREAKEQAEKKAKALSQIEAADAKLYSEQDLEKVIAALIVVPVGKIVKTLLSDVGYYYHAISLSGLENYEGNKDHQHDTKGFYTVTRVFYKYGIMWVQLNDSESNYIAYIPHRAIVVIANL